MNRSLLRLIDLEYAAGRRQTARSCALLSWFHPSSGSRFIYYHPTSKRRAVIPRRNRDIPKGTLLSLLREAGFTREEFVHFLKNE
jgi:HicA toxin of bacterial toxin-antitoxin,